MALLDAIGWNVDGLDDVVDSYTTLTQVTYATEMIAPEEALLILLSARADWNTEDLSHIDVDGNNNITAWRSKFALAGGTPTFAQGGTQTTLPKLANGSAGVSGFKVVDLNSTEWAGSSAFVGMRANQNISANLLNNTGEMTCFVLATRTIGGQGSAGDIDMQCILDSAGGSVTTLSFRAGVGDNGASVFTTSDVDDDSLQWPSPMVNSATSVLEMIGWTFDKNTKKFANYKGGTFNEVATTGATLDTSTLSTISIGTDRDGNADAFKGFLFRVVFFDHSLSQTQFDTLYSFFKKEYQIR
jgi:hypothetical protein